MRGVYGEEVYFSVAVTAKTKDNDMIDNSVVYGTNIVRSFNPDNYLKNGYQDPIAIKEPDYTFEMGKNK